MPNGDLGDLEGTTFTVYAYVVKESKPVGPREVMRGANLSSPSVAYRHLQKLEELGLVEKNEEGRYVIKEKAKISGYLWVGSNLVPRLIFYSLFFMGLFVTEITIITIRYFIYGITPELLFVYLTFVTAIAMALFLMEGISLRKKANIE
ncbi:MAG TPA: ArsR family transcriptional regulator [Candidatus Bathyarchaeota archaeon]|mgnify:CR=1 FL=1|jgi:DNA-binding transcriptional ArsR family regulator|nr:ArsR family transcriptional regulator [Candidatus Bathyarchaeota archaeon]